MLAVEAVAWLEGEETETNEQRPFALPFYWEQAGAGSSLSFLGKLQFLQVHYPLTSTVPRPHDLQ